MFERRAAEGAHERAQRSVLGLIDLSGDLDAAKAKRAKQEVEQARQQLLSGAAEFRARFMADRAAKAKADYRAQLAREATELR